MTVFDPMGGLDQVASIAVFVMRTIYGVEQGKMMSLLKKFGLLAVVVLAVGSCGKTREVTRLSTAHIGAVPAMRWEHRPESDQWTKATIAALRSHGAALPALTPRDIQTWCPAYPNASQSQREAFWVGLLSTLAKHESTWNPRAVGGGGRWFGLVQISPATARGYGCQARSGESLKDGVSNLSCAVRIAAVTVPRDGVVSRGGRGFAADWAPFNESRKRADMIAWTRSQSYCGGRG